MYEREGGRDDLRAKPYREKRGDENLQKVAREGEGGDEADGFHRQVEGAGEERSEKYVDRQRHRHEGGGGEAVGRAIAQGGA